MIYVYILYFLPILNCILRNSVVNFFVWDSNSLYLTSYHLLITYWGSFPFANRCNSHIRKISLRFYIHISIKYFCFTCFLYVLMTLCTTYNQTLVIIYSRKYIILFDFIYTYIYILFFKH